MHARDLRRAQGLVIGVAALIVLAVIGLGFYHGFDASTKANVWVAVGTLFLALITWWSLSQTRAVIAAEDRRHQQGFAPLLTIAQTESSDGRIRMTVSNVGHGIAQRVLVQLSGYFTNRSNPNAATLAIPRDSEAHHISVIAVRGRAGLSFPIVIGTLPFVHLKSIRIEYADMFGNGYVTEYLAFSVNPNEMRWQQPGKSSDCLVTIRANE